MNASKITFLDQTPIFGVCEESPDYDAEDADHAKELHKAQQLVGQALNLAGLLLAALEDQGDRRAMQVYVAVQVIEKKLGNAHDRLDKHEAGHARLYRAFTALREKAERAE